jgi:hypothetical protein
VYSIDGVTWTAVKGDTFGLYGIHDIAYGGGRFVAAGYGGIAYSNKQE